MKVLFGKKSHLYIVFKANSSFMMKQDKRTCDNLPRKSPEAQQKIEEAWNPWLRRSEIIKVMWEFVKVTKNLDGTE